MVNSLVMGVSCCVIEMSKVEIKLDLAPCDLLQSERETRLSVDSRQYLGSTPALACTGGYIKRDEVLFSWMSITEA